MWTVVEARGQGQHPFKVPLGSHQEIGSNLVCVCSVFLITMKATLIYKSLGCGREDCFLSGKD